MSALLWLAASAQPASAPQGATGDRLPIVADCQALLRQGQAELGIDYRKFDQANESGWRKLRFSGCAKEALSLIDEYLTNRSADLKDNQKANLNFHAAQVALSQGLEGRAQFYLGRSLLATDTSDMPLDWNSYVRATFAFVVRDWSSFNRNYEILSTRRVPVPNCPAESKCFRGDSNFPAVGRLRACWGEPYRIAYYECEPAAPATDKAIASERSR